MDPTASNTIGRSSKHGDKKKGSSNDRKRPRRPRRQKRGEEDSSTTNTNMNMDMEMGDQTAVVTAIKSSSSSLALASCSDNYSSCSSDGCSDGSYFTDEEEDMDWQIDFLSEKQELLQRATRILKEEEAYNAVHAHALIAAEETRRREDQDHLPTTSLWVQAKEIVEILNQRGDTGGRPPNIKKEKKKKKQTKSVRFQEAEEEGDHLYLPKTKKKKKTLRGIDLSVVRSIPAKEYRGEEGDILQALADTYADAVEMAMRMDAAGSTCSTSFYCDTTATADLPSSPSSSSSSSSSSPAQVSAGSSGSDDASTADSTNNSEMLVRQPQQPQSLEYVLASASFVTTSSDSDNGDDNDNNNACWMAKALQRQALKVTNQAPTTITNGNDCHWTIYSDPITFNRCLVPPPSQMHNGIPLHQAIAITNTPQLVTQSTPPFTIVHVNRGFSLLSNIPAEQIFGSSVERLFHLLPFENNSNNYDNNVDDQAQWFDCVVIQKRYNNSDNNNNNSTRKYCRIRVIPVIEKRPAKLKSGRDEKGNNDNGQQHNNKNNRNRRRPPPCIMSHILVQVQETLHDTVREQVKEEQAGASLLSADSSSSSSTAAAVALNNSSIQQAMAKDCLQETVG